MNQRSSAGGSVIGGGGVDVRPLVDSPGWRERFVSFLGRHPRRAGWLVLVLIALLFGPLLTLAHFNHQNEEIHGWLLIALAATSGVALYYFQRWSQAREALEAERAARLQAEVNHRINSLAEGLQSARQDLREREQWLALTGDAAQVGVWVRNLATGRIRVSAKWLEQFGFGPRDPVKFELLLQRVVPEDREGLLRALDGAVKTDGRYETEFRITLPDGSIRWIGSRGMTEFNADRKAMLMRSVCLDITERKQKEQVASQRHRELIHLSRVAMLGGLSGAIAHELNQPLTSILSNAQAAQRFLAKSTLDVDEMREILSDIVSEDRRAGEIIRHLRMLLSPAESARQMTDVNDLIAETLPLMGGEFASQHVTVYTELAPSLPKIHADRVQLQQVIINLLINGCEAMHGVPTRDGCLIVRTEPAVGEGVCVSVIDRGCGIPPEALTRIFESFFTTKSGGMGLGLSVCQSIIKTHGGRIWAENNAGGGASFRFSLPINETEAA